MSRAHKWLRGWYLYWRAVRQVRTKKHGVGAQPWPITFYLASCARFISYGQHYPRSRSFRVIHKHLYGGYDG